MSDRIFNPSNKPGTCLFCGQKLRFLKISYTGGAAGKLIPRSERPNAYRLPGPYGDGFFCTKDCGFEFAVIAASRGARYRRKGANMGSTTDFSDAISFALTKQTSSEGGAA